MAAHSYDHSLPSGKWNGTVAGIDVTWLESARDKLPSEMTVTKQSEALLKALTEHLLVKAAIRLEADRVKINSPPHDFTIDSKTGNVSLEFYKHVSGKFVGGKATQRNCHVYFDHTGDWTNVQVLFESVPAKKGGGLDLELCLGSLPTSAIDTAGPAASGSGSSTIPGYSATSAEWTGAGFGSGTLGTQGYTATPGYSAISTGGTDTGYSYGDPGTLSQAAAPSGAGSRSSRSSGRQTHSGSGGGKGTSRHHATAVPGGSGSRSSGRKSQSGSGSRGTAGHDATTAADTGSYYYTTDLAADTTFSSQFDPDPSAGLASGYPATAPSGAAAGVSSYESYWEPIASDDGEIRHRKWMEDKGEYKYRRVTADNELIQCHWDRDKKKWSDRK